MKKNNLKYFRNLAFITIPVFLIITFFTAFDAKYSSLPAGYTDKNHYNASLELIKTKRGIMNFQGVSLFKKSEEVNTQAINNFVNKASFLKIQTAKLNDFNSAKLENILFRVEYIDNQTFELELTRVNLIPEGFKIEIINGSNREFVDYEPGLYYQGIVKGDESSFATLSVFKNNVMCIISTDKGNYVLGAIKDDNKNLTDEYIFYNDRDIIISPDFSCGTRDDFHRFSEARLVHKSNGLFSTTQPIENYFVCDYRMYQDNGSDLQNVANFVSGCFLHVRTLYQNEQIPVALAPFIMVYTSNDPYSSLVDSYNILNLFGANTQDNFEGDLAHLLSTRNAQLGGIAWIRILCQSYTYFPPPDNVHYGRFAFSNIENSYLPYPQYSWTVTVITHEAGHNLGSRHTHSCVWPTNSGQIDSCVSISGESCVPFTVPNFNGTIMSYCHLNGSINLTSGFGPLPGDTIRLRYSQAQCIDSALNSSEIPLAYLLMQNYPNPFNPATNIKFGLPEPGYVTLTVYDITGREVAELVNNRFYEAGIFSVIFSSNDYNLASGVYLYKLTVSSSAGRKFSEIKKMALIK
jgi:hypothetical protein